jgi:PI-3-kinase-related kinase SMG-1
MQVTYSRLSQERRAAGPAGVGPVGRASAWVALELVGALERAVAHAAEGHAGRDALPPPVLAFFAANRKVGPGQGAARGSASLRSWGV